VALIGAPSEIASRLRSPAQWLWPEEARFIVYLTRHELSVEPGYVQQFETNATEYLKLLREQAGLVRATLLNSLGHPNRYTTLEQWQQREDSKAFARSSALSDFLRSHPTREHAHAERPVEAYEVVHRIVGSGKPVAAYLIDEIVATGPGNLEQFEESRGEVYRLRKAFGTGFAVSLLSRFLGGSNRYLIFGGFMSPGDDQRTAQAPEIRRYWAEHPSAEKLVPSAIRDPQVLVAVTDTTDPI
jgi:heme-degrading monooxygenase HmoA